MAQKERMFLKWVVVGRVKVGDLSYMLVAQLFPRRFYLVFLCSCIGRCFQLLIFLISVV
jgi:hypothetical protein